MLTLLPVLLDHPRDSYHSQQQPTSGDHLPRQTDALRLIRRKVSALVRLPGWHHRALPSRSSCEWTSSRYQS
jgi:hypothetical protein